MKKRIFSIILTLCMVLPFVPTKVYAANTFGDFEYSVSDTNEVTITKYNGRGGAVEIPDKIDGRTVTAIGERVFRLRTSLTSITIPDSVTSIGDSAFYSCTGLTSITIPNGVTSIGTSTFSECTGLTSITIPDSVTSIKEQAFFNCTSLTNINIPKSLSSIAYATFEYCQSLTSITIPDSVTSIDSLAFNNCTNLASITIPETVTFIGEYAFYNTVWLNSKKQANPLVVVNGILIDGTSATGIVRIPDSVTSIGDSAFSGCRNLTSVTIPDSVTTIRSNAFNGCTGLTSITIPNSVTSIGESVFSYCTINRVTIPDSVTSIGYTAFVNCQNLKSIFLPARLIVGLQSTTIMVKYILDENSEVTITEINLGINNDPVDIPDTIGGYPVIAVKASEQSKVGAHTHVGGYATCQTKAICGICGKEYGEVDSSNHNLEKIPAKDATVTATGNKEYWHCKDCDKYFSDKDGKNVIELKDTIIQKLSPEITEGQEQSITTGEKKDLTFRSNAAFSDFIRVVLDGKTLDEKNYTVKEGSTIVTLKADYVATLSKGKHTISIVSTSGTATTTFKINAKTTVDNNTKPTQTGDNTQMSLWIALLFVSGGILIDSKKKKYN